MTTIVFADGMYTVEKRKKRGSRAVYIVYSNHTFGVLRAFKNIGEADSLSDARRIIERDKGYGVEGHGTG
mgnify:CR=1 FL=1